MRPAAYTLPLFALAGAVGAMALLALIAGRDGGVALFTLAGLMIASLCGALMSLAISLFADALRPERDRHLVDGRAFRSQLARRLDRPAADARRAWFPALGRSGPPMRCRWVK